MKEFILVLCCFLILGGVIYFMWDRRVEYFAGSTCNLYSKQEKDECYQKKAIRSGSLFFCERIEAQESRVFCHREVESIYGD